MTQQFVLLGAVALVGVLHTLVPDHWAPIALLARQHAWTRRETARTAAIAGIGHTVSTLLIAIVVWIAGVAFAERFGHLVGAASSIALVAFGGWILVSAWREVRTDKHDHDHDHDQIDAGASEHAHHHHAPLIDARKKISTRTALLLIVGSSPMIEGIPAFFAAARFGTLQLVAMSLVFALTTISTYVVLCVASVASLQRLRLGALERYGEVLSGGFIAALGFVFFFFPAL